MESENNNLRFIADKFFLEFKDKFNPRNILKLSYNEDLFPSFQPINSSINYDLILATLYPSEIEIDNPDDEDIDTIRIKEDEKIEGKYDGEITMPNMNEFNFLGLNGNGLLFVPFFSNEISKYLNKKGLYIKAILKLPETKIDIKKIFNTEIIPEETLEHTSLYSNVPDEDDLDDITASDMYNEEMKDEEDEGMIESLKQEYEKKLGCEVSIEKCGFEYEIEYTNLFDIEPYLLIISKQKANKIFFSELNTNSDYGKIIENFKTDRGINIENGLYIKSSKGMFDFIWETDKNDVSEEISLFLNEDNKFIKYNISDLFIDGDESVFNLKDLGQNIFNEEINIPINSKIVLPPYLKYYFKSSIGKTIIDNLLSKIIPLEFYDDIELVNLLDPKIILANLIKLNQTIPLPSLEEQRYFIEDIEKLERTKKSVSEIEEEFYKKPIRIDEISEKLHSVLDSFKKLTESDKIKFLCKRGESKEVEFKKTISGGDFSEKEIKGLKPIIKSINAFLNTLTTQEKCTILVGVHDNGEILGINKTDPNYIDDDKYKQKLSNLINDYVGKEYTSLINFNIIPVEDKKILRIDISPNNGFACFKKFDEEIYTRVGPESRPVKKSELIKLDKELKLYYRKRRKNIPI